MGVDFKNRECFRTEMEDRNRTQDTQEGLALVLHNFRVSFEINRALAETNSHVIPT